jgi:hypothetical protein
MWSKLDRSKLERFTVRREQLNRFKIGSKRVQLSGAHTKRKSTKHKEQNALSITAKTGKLLNKYEKQIFK